MKNYTLSQVKAECDKHVRNRCENCEFKSTTEEEACLIIDDKVPALWNVEIAPLKFSLRRCPFCNAYAYGERLGNANIYMIKCEHKRNCLLGSAESVQTLFHSMSELVDAWDGNYDESYEDDLK